MSQHTIAIYLVCTIPPDSQNLGRHGGNPPIYYGNREYFLQVLGGQHILLVVFLAMGCIIFMLTRYLSVSFRSLTGIADAASRDALTGQKAESERSDKISVLACGSCINKR